MRPTTKVTPSRGLARATVVAMTLWGLLHVVGGIALMVESREPVEGLRLLGSAVESGLIPAAPGPVVAALIGFHGLNIAFAGLVVTLLSLLWSWRQWPRGVPTSLFIATAADIGLVVYLLGPGYMRISDGLWGPLLLVIALITGALSWGRTGTN